MDDANDEEGMGQHAAADAVAQEEPQDSNPPLQPPVHEPTNSLDAHTEAEPQTSAPSLPFPIEPDAEQFDPLVEGDVEPFNSDVHALPLAKNEVDVPPLPAVKPHSPQNLEKLDNEVLSCFLEKQEEQLDDKFDAMGVHPPQVESHSHESEHNSKNEVRGMEVDTPVDELHSPPKGEKLNREVPPIGAETPMTELRSHENKEPGKDEGNAMKALTPSAQACLNENEEQPKNGMDILTPVAEAHSQENEVTAMELHTSKENGNLNQSFLLDTNLYGGSESGTDEEQVAFMKELENFFRERSMEFKPPKFYGEGLNCLK